MLRDKQTQTHQGNMRSSHPVTSLPPLPQEVLVMYMCVPAPLYIDVCDSISFSDIAPLGSDSGGSGLSGGEIAAIVIAVVVALLLFLLVVVVVIFLCHMWYRKVKNIGPPPSRAGSKRFVS